MSPAEIWLRDDLGNIYMLLIRFLRNSFLLALCNFGWLTTQKFVILVPDPIVFAPWSVLLDCTASFVRTRSRHIFRASFCGAFLWYTMRNKDDMDDGVPTDQRSHNHCDCTDCHCSSHSVASCVCLRISSQPLSQDDGGGYLPQCLRPQAVRHGHALCHLSRHTSQSHLPRAGS